MAKQNMYWDDSGNIFRILNTSQQESLVQAPNIIPIILFCNLNMYSLCVVSPENQPMS